MNDKEGGIGDQMGTIGKAIGGMVGIQISCGARDAANIRLRHGVKAWRYRFFGEFPNTEISPTAGAWHGIEQFSVFGTAELLLGIPETSEQVVLGKKVRRAWSTFAKNPTSGLSELGWPVYDDSSE